MDTRLDPATAGWAIGQPSGEPVMRAWMRFADGREPDPLALVIFADALPPTSFAQGNFGWAPTVQLQVLRPRPARAGLVPGRGAVGDLLQGLDRVGSGRTALIACSQPAIWSTGTRSPQRKNCGSTITGMNCTAWNSVRANALASSPRATPSTASATAMRTTR